MSKNEFSWDGGDGQQDYTILINGDTMEAGAVVEFLEQRDDFIDQLEYAQAQIVSLNRKLDKVHEYAESIEIAMAKAEKIIDDMS